MTISISAMPVREADFSAYGTVHSLAAPGTPASEVGLVRSSGLGWTDTYTAAPLLSTTGSLGYTLGEGGPFDTVKMERHLDTQEALFCAAKPIVLAVAAATEAARPKAGDIRAFIIEPGTVVVMHKGTWHDACRGIDEPTHYYWMATCGGGSVWVDVEGGPVHVTAAGRFDA
jgi:ureidoglycolate lyase